MLRGRVLGGGIAAAIGVVVGGWASAHDANPYVRATLGVDWSLATIFFDRDCTRPNTGPQPWSLYGCGVGEDGRTLGAYGDFGSSIFLELGVGIEPSPGVRVESTIGYRPGFAFTGNANFINSGLIQPTTATVDQFNITNFVYIDLLEAAGIESRIQPFIGGGFGVIRNALSSVRIEVPFFVGPQLFYVQTPAGVNWDVTWTLVAGIGFELSERATIEVAYRFNQLGDVETEQGVTFVQYHTGGTATFDTVPTFAPLSSHGLTLALRWAL